jgi:hypothetical protein
MTKRLLVCLLALVLSVQIAGCSSNESRDDVGVAEANDDYFSEESDGDFANNEEDAGSASVADGGAAAGDDLDAEDLDGGGDLADSGDLDEDFGDGETKVAQKKSSNGDLDDLDESGDELALDSGDDLPDDALPEDPAAKPKVAQEPAPYQEPEPMDQYAQAPSDESIYSEKENSGESGFQSVEPRSYEVASSGGYGSGGFIPVKKIRDTAFAAADGTNLNRVYLGRPGDTVKSISQKIYGQNRSKDLLAWNSHLRSGVKTGDKVYYSSPNSPGDFSMKTFYEDAGVEPAVYVSSEGDNIRKVSKELLGSSESWKEVWATNMNVESKGDIPAGVELRYWPEGTGEIVVAKKTNSVPPPAAAKNQAAASPPPAPMDDFPPMDMAPPPADDFQQMAENPQQMPNDMAMEPPPPAPPQDFNPEDPASGDEAAIGSIAPPPPPPPDQMAPPEPKPVAKKAASAEVSSADSETLMALGFAGILALAIAVLFTVIRKNRARHADLGQTQV